MTYQIYINNATSAKVLTISNLNANKYLFNQTKKEFLLNIYFLCLKKDIILRGKKE